MSEKTSSTGAPSGAEAPPAVPARWSAGRKTEVVLRLCGANRWIWWPARPRCPRRVEDLGGAAGQGNTVVALRLHARGGDGPHASLRVHLVPRGPAHLAGAHRRQDWRR